MKTVTVPKLFFDDHANRGCVEYSGDRSQYIVQENKLRVTVRLDERDIEDLMSDAEYYGNKRGESRWSDIRSICQSATRTVHALESQGIARVNGWRVY